MIGFLLFLFTTNLKGVFDPQKRTHRNVSFEEFEAIALDLDLDVAAPVFRWDLSEAGTARTALRAIAGAKLHIRRHG